MYKYFREMLAFDRYVCIRLCPHHFIVTNKNPSQIRSDYTWVHQYEKFRNFLQISWKSGRKNIFRCLFTSFAFSFFLHHSHFIIIYFIPVLSCNSFFVWIYIFHVTKWFIINVHLGKHLLFSRSRKTPVLIRSNSTNCLYMCWFVTIWCRSQVKTSAI